MGVDLETYRGRIGTFRCGSGVDVIILYCTINFSGCFKYIGSVAFIGILLLIGGIESNPGPTDTGFKAESLDLDNPLFKNWVRAAIGLKYLKLGLLDFIDQNIRQQHSYLLKRCISDTGHPATNCSSCTFENLMPEHSTPREHECPPHRECDNLSWRKHKGPTHSERDNRSWRKHEPYTHSERDNSSWRKREPYTHSERDNSSWRKHEPYTHSERDNSSCRKHEPYTHNEREPLTRRCIQKDKNNCFCEDDSNRKRRSCPNKFCSRFYDLIIEAHFEKNPLWENTKPTLWYSNYFEFAKCFLGTKSYINIITDIDATGLLSIAIHDRYICDAISGIGNFIQCRKDRNEIMHTKSYELEDTQLVRYINKMIAVLQDRCLCKYPSARKAIEKLEQLKKDQIYISSEDAEEMRRSLAAISEITEKSLHDMKQETIHGVDKHILLSKSSFEQDIKKFTATEKSEFTATVQLVIAKNKDAALKSIVDFGMETKSDIQCQLESEMEKRIAKLIDEYLENTTANKSRTTDAESYEADKKGLQQHLVELYQTYYVMTSASPIDTKENDINISDVYVSPKMVVTEKDGTKKQINHYQDIFLSRDGRNKKVYIIGDAGTGKSSFCKMMMQNWCSAVTRKLKNEDSESMDKRNVQTTNDDNIRDIGTFEFLFYIPLCYMSGYDIFERVKAQLKSHRLLIENIFSNESESCLILADGLDEWTISEESGSHLPHLTHGIPTSDHLRDATLITTSRPSARGVLHMKSTEYHLKVTLLGVNEMSQFVEKYMALFKSSSAVEEFHRKLLKTCIRTDVLQESPMLLQQIIFMHCEGHEIGQSVAYIYSNIVNIVFGWLEEKGWKRLAVNNSIKPQLLPKHFEKFERCQENQDLIILLGNVAYNIFVKEDNSSVVIGRHKLESFGFTTGDICAVLQLGILKEEKCGDRSKANLQISFVHTLYLEFFAAVYISSCCLPQTETEQRGTTHTSLIKNLILNKASAVEILRLKNILIMVCGLSPLHTESICDCIYKVASKDLELMEYRRKLSSISLTPFRSEVREIQDMCFKCVSESKSNNGHVQPPIKLCDLDLKWVSEEQMCFSCIASVSLISLSGMGSLLPLSHKVCTLLSSFLLKAVSLKTLDLQVINSDCDGYTIDLSHNEQLNRLVLTDCKHISVSGSTTNLKSCEISDCSLTHKLCKLFSFLSQAVSLQSLIIRKTTSTQPECDGHTIDLSSNEQLEYVELRKCDHISVSGISPTTNLKTCAISDCSLTHEQWKSFSVFLSQSVSLQLLILEYIKCTQPECDGHTIDLSSNEQLENLLLRKSNHIFVSGVNPTTNLKKCILSDCSLTHKQWKSFSLFLSQAVSLQSLKLGNIKCTQTECDGHTIDLSRHEQLQHLELSECEHISVSGISPAINLKLCKISDCSLTHELCELLSLILSQSISLQSLKLGNIKCTQPECDGHTIDLSSHEQLECLELSKCEHISVSGISPAINLKLCKISDCSLTHELCELLSLILSQSVSLQSLKLGNIKCTQPECDGHTIDLSSHEQLQHLELSKCEHISVSGISPAINLESCEISDCSLTHELCKSLSLILSQSVLLHSLLLWNIKCTQPECDGHTIDLSSHEQLECLELSKCDHISVSGISPATNLKSCKISDCSLTHEQCELLSLFLSQSVSLPSLKLGNIKCTQPECDGHTIDLSRHEQLQHLELSECEHISVSGISPAINLKLCKIRECSLTHELCELLSLILSQSVSLKGLILGIIKCTQTECDGHTIDLSRHEQLEYLFLCKCDHISVSGVSPTTNLKLCALIYCSLSHELCELLSLILSQSVLLHSLILRNIKCTQPECDGHTIEMSRHEQLECLELSKCDHISVSGVSPTINLKTCEISDCSLTHDLCKLFSLILSQSVSLQSLVLGNIKCTQTECDGHTIDLSGHEQLECLELSKCDHISVSGVSPTTNLKSCKISDCSLTHELCILLSLFLSGSVSLPSLKLGNIKCTQTECDGHTIDLSRHEQLQHLELSECEHISVSGISPTINLKCCEISDCSLTHELCELLSLILAQSVSLQSLVLGNIKCTQPECDGHTIDLSRHEQLQHLELSKCEHISVSGISPTINLKFCEISDCSLTHEQWKSFSLFLSQAVSLQSLKLGNIKCTQPECDGHTIDMSRHEQLECLELSKCDHISVSGVSPTTNLKSCKISDCSLTHELCILLSLFLSGSVSLPSLKLGNIKCTKTECDGHTIDLSRHEQLECLELSECDHISVSGVSPTTNLKLCEISDCYLTHELCKLFSLFLSQSVSLQSLVLGNIKCTQPECDGHTIDLSGHEQLECLELSKCDHISVSGVSPSTNLKSCEISDCSLTHELCILLSLFLSGSVSLPSLKLGNIKCTQPECDGHTIDLSRHEQLQHLELSKCEHISVSGISPTINLKLFEISDCSLTHELCESLSLILSQSVSLQGVVLGNIKCTQTECDGHTIDMSRHEQLEYLFLSKCDHISVSGVSPTTNLKLCAFFYCSLTHEQCKLFSLFLSQSVLLHSLLFGNIKCTQTECDGHTIDLSRHEQLKYLFLSQCDHISVSGVSPTTDLKLCKIRDCSLTHLCKLLSFLARLCEE